MNDETTNPLAVVIEAMSRSNVTGPQPLASLASEVDADSEEELRFEAALRADEVERGGYEKDAEADR
jgi:hypothetical protein